MANVAVLKPDRTQLSIPEEEMRMHWDRGAITIQDIYWKEGMPDWRPLAEFFHGLDIPATYGSPRYAFANDPTDLTRFVVNLLWWSLALGIADTVYAFAKMGAPAGGHSNLGLALVQLILGLAEVVVGLMTGINFLRWVYRASLNARGFGAKHMRFTPGWSVGWFFIPFLNLVRPFEAMSEIWRVSQEPAEWESLPTPPILRLWWALWVVGGFVNVFATQMSFRNHDPSAAQAAHSLMIVGNIIHIPLTIVAIQVVNRIYQMQLALTQRPA